MERGLRVSGKKCVLGHPIAQATSYCLLPDTFWLRASKNVFKVGSVNSQIHCHCLLLWKKYAPEVKAAKGLKLCRAKVKGVTNPTWTSQYPTLWQCPLLALLVRSPQMVWVCVCVCVQNNLYALCWHIHISVHFMLCQCYTQAHTHPQTI